MNLAGYLRCTVFLLMVGVGALAHAGEPGRDLLVYPIDGAALRATRVVVAANASGDVADKLVYSNTEGRFALEVPGNTLISDDLTLTVEGGCALRRLLFEVTGKAKPFACSGTGGDCGPYRVDYALYDACPNAGGQLIEGTAGCASTDGVGGCLPIHTAGPIRLGLVVPSETTIPLPPRVWLALRFNRDHAGIIVGAPALEGFSQDVFDYIGFSCAAGLGGFPGQPHASFNAQLYADPACADTHLTYQNIAAEKPGFSAGINGCVADDLSLNRACDMVAMEVGVRNRGIYEIALQPDADGSPIGGCSMEGAADDLNVPGTFRAFVVNQDGLQLRRFTFDPPIPLPQRNIFALMKIRNADAGWILTQHEASVGFTRASYHVWNEQINAWERRFLPNGKYGGFHLAITCAGEAPVGACCDQYLRDESDEAVCRDVPEINCPFPPKGSRLNPGWADGVPCHVCEDGVRDGLGCRRDDECAGGMCVDNDPFELPCGASACCKPGEGCSNLTKNECDLLFPLDAPRDWQLGQFCAIDGQRCPAQPCLNGEGDCLSARPKRCCGGPDDGSTCNRDSECGGTADGECVDIEPRCVGGDQDGQACHSDLDCVPGGLCVTSRCIGGARDGRTCQGNRDCAESYCKGNPGCGDPFCCTHVCSYAPGPNLFTEFCCEVDWDVACADLAQRICASPPENDDCAPSERREGAREVRVDGPSVQTNSESAFAAPNEVFCCHGGLRRCDGGCRDGEQCTDASDCVGKEDGFCDFAGDPATGVCVAGCNAHEVCAGGPDDVVETFCFGGDNANAPCAPRCTVGSRAGEGCGHDAHCPFNGVCLKGVCYGGARSGAACAGDVGCAGTATCDPSADCPGGVCLNAYCEGARSGVCADAVPEPGNTGYGGVWYYFTVPEEQGSDNVNIEVTTCGSAIPAFDSLLQVFAAPDTDRGVCVGLGQCADGSFCTPGTDCLGDEIDPCADGSACRPASAACSVAQQDCPQDAACVPDKAFACDHLTAIGCNDDAPDGCGSSTRARNSKLCLPDLQRGSTYYILVAAKTEDADGVYNVRVRTVTACEATSAPNDYCSNAIDLPDPSANIQPVTGAPFVLDDATFDCMDLPCNTSLRNDLWYRVTAPVTGPMTVSTCGTTPESSPDTELMVYDGCGCPPPRDIPPTCASACNDPNCLSSACTMLDVVEGACYTIRLGDNQGNGGAGRLTITFLGCSAGAVTALDPPDGVVDAGYPINCTTGAVLGIDTLRFSGPAYAGAQCWSLCESAAIGEPNGIAGVVQRSEGIYTVTLNRPMTPGACTSILYDRGGANEQSTTFMVHPGDVGADGASNPADVLELIDVLNGAPAVFGRYSSDVDRSGASNAADVLAVIDLLNGAGCFDPWNNVAFPGCGNCPDP